MSQPQTNTAATLPFSLKPLKSAWTICLLIPFGLAVLDPTQLEQIMKIALSAFLNTLPYIVFAVATIAYLKASGAQNLIAKIFQGRETSMIFLAALFGGLAPFCSCEVIPFIAGLLSLGAPLAAVMAFWLSSPLIDPPTLLITAAALGWPFAIAKAVFAVCLGLFGGFAIKLFNQNWGFNDPLRERKSNGCCGSKKAPVSEKPHWKFWTEKSRIADFMAESRINGLFLIKWLALAYMLEGLLITYIPAQTISHWVGGQGIFTIATAAFVGIPAYLNGYVAPALLAGLIDQGMSVGAAMSFMVAGAVSSIPAMAAVWSLVKPPVFIAYLGLGVIGAILSGLIFQYAM